MTWCAICLSVNGPLPHTPLAQ
uniref:Uncharacterized protein n=1 Tax=Anguilla anguilla TaxID=7936 RepID=A0A0E9QJT8_ANGAN